MRRELAITAERLRSYSRSGNFHTDPGAAAELGYPGMVAQGMHVAGVAYGALIDTWGEDFLSLGELDLNFVGVVLDGQTVVVECEPGDEVASFEITEQERTVVVGRASRPRPGTRPQR